MLEFPHPDEWKDRLGDDIDEIQVHSAQSANRFDLLDLNHIETPPRWVSLPSAGRTCGDRVRAAVVGTWRYEEGTFDGGEGRIELTHPERSELIEFHPVLFALLPTQLWFLAGIGLRSGEQHRDYRTDFLGSPTPDPERDPQWYLFLRFRTALE